MITIWKKIDSYLGDNVISNLHSAHLRPYFISSTLYLFCYLSDPSNGKNRETLLSILCRNHGTDFENFALNSLTNNR